MPYHYHIIAFLAGFAVDLLLGDPQGWPHPVCLIGRLIFGLERWLLDGRSACREKNGQTALADLAEPGSHERQPDRENQAQLRRGIWLVLLVLSATLAAASAVLLGAYLLHPVLGVLAETVMTWQILAVKSLRVESMRVYHVLREEGLPAGRKAVAMIVGRDTERLDEAGVIRAAVETVAENTSDGIIAPMLYLAAGGPILGFVYKAVNTMDSMVGYKNEKYLYFGRAAARLDDAVNWIPARVSAGLMLAACAALGRRAHAGGRVLAVMESTSADLGGNSVVAGESPAAGREVSAAAELYNVRRARAVYRRDCRKHASPNSAQTESVCAGALGVRLAGDAWYFGKKVKKPYIGDALREIEREDIVRANRLTALTAWLCELLCLILMGGALWLI